MTEVTFLQFFENEGDIFRVSGSNGLLTKVEIFDKVSRIFKPVKIDITSFLFDIATKSFDPNDLPLEIKEAM